MVRGRRLHCEEGSPRDWGQATSETTPTRWGREEQGLCRREEACGFNCRAYDLVDSVVADKRLPALIVGDEDKFHWPFRGGENRCGLVRLFVCGDKLHVPRRDLYEGRHAVVSANFGGAPRCIILDWEDQDN